VEKNDNLTFAENLIQIWCRKKCAHDHKDGDVYWVEVGMEYSGDCPTCGDSDVPALKIHRTRTTYRGKTQKKVMSLTSVNCAETLNEMLYALKPLDES
jgi:hypothetical protein